MNFVTYHTPDYAPWADELKQDARRLGLSLDVEVIPSAGSWAKNIWTKTKFIADRIEAAHDGARFCWIDADSRILEAPTLLDRIDSDFAARWWPSKRGWEPMAAVMLFSVSPATREWARKWAGHYVPNATRPDQGVMLQTMPKGIAWACLPPAYNATGHSGAVIVGRRMKVLRRKRG